MNLSTAARVEPCCGREVPENVARLIANEILCQELCDFYVANGDLILYPACTTKHSQQEQAPFACPTPQWLSTLDPAKFYALYTAKLPTAKTYL